MNAGRDGKAVELINGKGSYWIPYLQQCAIDYVYFRLMVYNFSLEYD